MKAFLTALVPVVALAAACSATPVSRGSSPEYWRATSTGANQFPSDNLACSARTSRLANLGTLAPENRLDRPMQKWPNASAQEIYEGCMLERGWRPAG
jgi:hypothetical protein